MKPSIPITSEDIPDIVKLLINKSRETNNGRFNSPSKKRLMYLAYELSTDLAMIGKVKKMLMKDECCNQYARRILIKLLQFFTDQESPFASSRKTLNKLIDAFKESELGDFADILTREYFHKEIKKTEESPVESLQRWHNQRLLYFHNNMSYSDNSARQLVLSNSLVLQEIFKQLPISDKKNFRLVNRTFWRETLCPWRRTMWMHLQRYTDDKTMKSFSKQFQKVRNREEWVDKTSLLVEFPFRRFKITAEKIVSPRSSPRNKHEETFWKVAGPQMTQLHIHGCTFEHPYGIMQSVNWIFTVCPNLEQLDVGGSMEAPLRSSCGAAAAAGKMLGGVARNLTKLKLDHELTESELKDLFQLTPKLKNLTTSKNLEKLLQGILAAAAPLKGNKKSIKLESIRSEESMLTSFTNLRQYARASPRSLKCLDLERVSLRPEQGDNDLSTLSSSISDFKDLETLRLTFLDERVSDDSEFLYLSIEKSISNLTKLEVEVHGGDTKFDLNSLKRMPNLEMLKLALCYHMPRKYGTRDWIPDTNGQQQQRGRRGGLSDRCNLHLKTLDFTGWSLNGKDVEILSDYFPNLCHIKTEMHGPALIKAVDSWTELEEVILRYSGDKISMKHFIEAKQEHEDVRIVYQSGYNSEYGIEPVVVKKEEEEEEGGSRVLFQGCDFLGGFKK